MRGSEVVIKTLVNHGVDTVFGYPGGAIMPIYDALYESPIEHLLCRHEQGAGFCAIGYARSSRRPGVCIATSGPGATNLITALADAMLDSVPIVAITGQVPTSAIGTDAFQEIDVIGMSMACTKHSFLVTDPNKLCQILHEAFSLACSGRPGPVLVDIPKDVQLAITEWKPPLESISKLFQPAPPDVDALLTAQKLLAAASRPLAYVGGGVSMADATDALRQFLQTSGIPSVCTLKGLGAVDPDNPLYLGMLGMHGGRAANFAVQDCDLLFAIGVRFDDRVTGQLENFAAGAKVIHIDADPAEFNKRKRADVALSQPMQWVLENLTARFDRHASIDGWVTHCQRSKSEHRHNYDKPGNGIYAPQLLRQLSAQLPRNSVVSCDVGQHQMWVAQHMRFHDTRNHLTSGGLGTMGFGLPAAIGAAVARPNDTIVLVSGDGSFMMNVQELNTIKRRQLSGKMPIKIVLLDNQKLGMVRQWQELFFDGRYSETDLCDNPDFVTLARAFGIGGRTITRRDQVAEALNEMLATEGAWLLHVRINALENVWPLVPPGAANHEMLEES